MELLRSKENPRGTKSSVNRASSSWKRLRGGRIDPMSAAETTGKVSPEHAAPTVEAGRSSRAGCFDDRNSSERPAMNTDSDSPGLDMLCKEGGKSVCPEPGIDAASPARTQLLMEKLDPISALPTAEVARPMQAIPDTGASRARRLGLRGSSGEPICANPKTGNRKLSQARL